MARAKREIDKEEIEEIILLKLEELGGRKSKLTANNVAKFSKEIANNEKYKRKNGKLFNYYGYDIWAGRYKGQDYYGKIKLAEIKNSIDVVAVGKEFIPDIQDIIILVDKNYKEPEKLSKKLISIFESDKKRIDKLSKELDKVKEQNKRLKQNFNEYINNLRIAEACNLLRESDKKIADISEDVGFGTIRSFNRAFKLSIGVSPAEYRSNSKILENLT